METVTHHGRTTAYRATDFGEGPRVCYVHGAGGAHDVWVEQYGDREGPPAVAVDLSGHGDSDDVETDPGVETLDAYAEDVVAVCEATGATVLCGNSMGGAVALWVALEYDLDVEALVLADTGAKLGVDDGLLEALDRNFESAVASLHVPDTLFHDPDDDLVEVSKRGLLSTGRAVTLRDFRTCDAFDVRDRLGEIEIPGLALCGEHDPMTPPRFAEYLADEMPDCEYVEIAAAAHMPMLERPDVFDDAVRSFLL
ncbi:alpha/beta fold hydrolase [Natronomonas marina]|jgi:pimeloyl-ACP methyl ester carboxylesterase|uniref:alpha/beta fold hydrolase n=1 Tax=Natronomonas marina TaxID=2961939 RepID=UPI0020C974AA|nr:alpha/beta hydrolase [Natronomonas marina]